MLSRRYRTAREWSLYRQPLRQVSVSQCISCIRIHVVEYHSGPIIDIPLITKRGWSELCRTSRSKGENVSRGREAYCRKRSACLYRSLSLACDTRARNFRTGKLEIPYASADSDTCVSRMVHPDRMRIGSRETAYPELCIPEAIWPDDRTRAPGPFQGTNASAGGT
jgi:hypothetical protein